MLGSSSGTAPVLDLHPFVDNQCRTAISHLQHEVKIPNCRARDVAAFPNLPDGPDGKVLEILTFRIWHKSCSDKGTGPSQMELMMQAQENQVALPLRSHTIFGVCEAIGEDFGFNPAFLRVPLAATVIINPLWAMGAYVALGVIVLASRLLFPARKADIAADAAQAIPANEQRELAKAA
jgi:phage shock protein PspC (stress-responsive transcriptional regulator)